MRERKRIEANKKLADLDYEEALKELDKEFPGIKVGNEITHYPFSEFVGKRGRPR